jgi:CheY-like chemotaxis protein
MVDVSQVEQIVMNLAVNSRQAMPHGGLLIIESSNVELGSDYARSHPEVEPGRYVQLMVSDTGMGMSPEVQRRAFEPFFTTKAAGKGTGLGLSVVYGAVRQLGGHINLYSEPNVGTTFRIYWPAVDAQVETVPPPPVRAVRPASHEVLLLVEDDALVRSFARRALQTQGYQVIDAEDAEKALLVAKSLSSAPDLLVTDVILPGQHGPALAKAVRELFPNIPVLFCSGYSEQLMNETGHLPTGATLLQKPYDARDLTTRVREMLDKRPRDGQAGAAAHTS